ncbi:MAG: formyltransferase family protein [Vicinamibacterales bacterium]
MPESAPGTGTPASHRIGVLTLAGSGYGQHLLWSLASHGQRPALVVVLDNPLSRKLTLLRSVARRIGWRDSLLHALDETLSPTRPSGAPRGSWPGYDKVADAVVRVSAVSTPAAADQLRRHDIDVLLLGQSGIVPQSLLDAPKLGTLNAHPGWLPDFKGIDCAAWTILAERFAFVGSSLHWVDAGVDTGRIIRQRPYRWRGDETLRSLEVRLYDDCIELLVDATRDLERGTLPSGDNVGGTLYRKMSRADRARAARLLSARLPMLASMDPGARVGASGASQDQLSARIADRLSESKDGR